MECITVLESPSPDGPTLARNRLLSAGVDAALVEGTRQVPVVYTWNDWGMEEEACYCVRVAISDVARAYDILGPLPRIACSPEWRTSTVIGIARQMYESQDFSTMPVLADALLGVGCASAEILDHCRSSSPHVRGCWVVDLVLGKE